MSRIHPLQHVEARMQPPTCTGIRIRSVQDAHILFHAVMNGILPIVTRRLDTEERRAVRAGNVYVWEERGRNAEATGLGIERWTDGIRWSASRVRDEFLLYHERDTTIDLDFNDMEAYANPEAANAQNDARANHRLVKQTYSVFVDTTHGRRKWHLTAYYVPASITQLRTVEDYPQIASLRPPEGMYTSAKVGKSRALPVTGATDIHRSAVPGASGSLSPLAGHHHHPQAYPTYAPYPNTAMSIPPPLPGTSSSPHGHGVHAGYLQNIQGAPALVIPRAHGHASQSGMSPVSSTSSSSPGSWSPFSPVAPPGQRDGRTLPTLPPPSSLVSPTSGHGAHGATGYHPRHPLDNEALKAFNRPI